MKKYFFLILLVCLGCNKKKTAKINISAKLSSDHSLKITGFNYAIVSDISRDSINNPLQYLLPVYKIPADTDMKNYQSVQRGTYKLKDSTVIFIPDTPFVKGKVYFLRYYKFGEGHGSLDLIKGKRRIGSEHYTDLIFNGQ
jgi:hypothetical protein